VSAIMLRNLPSSNAGDRHVVQAKYAYTPRDDNSLVSLP
jgi:hypothetical protein